jgi:hypothetical protein
MDFLFLATNCEKLIEPERYPKPGRHIKCNVPGPEPQAFNSALAEMSNGDYKIL